jgi:predicted nuclease with TOPRIM domain
MSASVVDPRISCGCLSDNAGGPSEPCCDCNTKMELTYEEEAILEKLRGIKAIVRPLVETLKGIELRRFDRIGIGVASVEEEWIRLSKELDELRTAWNEWEKKLEAAIERKLILLGHREPRA